MVACLVSARQISSASLRLLATERSLRPSYFSNMAFTSSWSWISMSIASLVPAAALARPAELPVDFDAPAMMGLLQCWVSKKTRRRGAWLRVSARAGAAARTSRGTSARAARTARTAARAGRTARATRTALLVAVVLVAHRAGLAGFFRGELVGIARSVGGAAPFGGDFTLLVGIHRGEAAVAGVAALAALAAASATLVTALVSRLLAALLTRLLVAAGFSALVIRCHGDLLIVSSIVKVSYRRTDRCCRCGDTGDHLKAGVSGTT